MIPSPSGNQTYTVSSPTNDELYREVVTTPKDKIGTVVRGPP